MPRKFDFISPGIQLTEVDQSTVPAQLQEDGPLLIGRALRGPSMKPIRIQSFDDFVTVFGNPVYGPQPGPMDIWRQGNTVAPTYAGIAAEAWLAANDTPITFVRLLGEQSTNATTAGYAGWDTSDSLIQHTLHQVVQLVFLLLLLVRQYVGNPSGSLGCYLLCKQRLN